MSALAMLQNKTALAVNLGASFVASGGTAPYVYSVRPNGAGGSIGSSTGLYIAPPVINAGSFGIPRNYYDTIQVLDSASTPNVLTSQILVGTPLLLFCDIIQTCLSLVPGRVYLWDQKMTNPTDSGIYIAVYVLSCKPFGVINTPDGSGGGFTADQSVNMYATLQIDAISRDDEARERKEEIIMALDSNYSRSQQEANSFYIGKIPPGGQFVNLSSQDGAAIPYRFTISVAMQYCVTKTVAVPYFNTFQTPQVNTNS